ncbi:MAG: hypothetical protein A2Y45_06265 [Tenericutes bacterium GWC2_34_14]|nr:MAG: hypothetical protein A2Z84_07370 [Tenericutes bacterium GWA2_35_7]OHE28559.1 MAG: hypothetical protein A2Y45_06265 [Tenericutes bacterium GWC2_34_14]OHE33533.1 MAG: hypothetical protein A2012_03545 [Tenericutes bacterium GWE2_34_108]OHE36818.1 MAG: hypothetical protein A2Y46_09345 [Tenericutes bacterium GWF1_35_14]OHE38102.1 MAG: hypothetical protein A2Y44_09320 [Tenericutes bacterium GWF2_35_184]OHE42730.1 MAG: hypothetical protein A3K26_06660 [Tenericutes bacterium RIFOXYA12_FULL_35_
MKKITLFLIVFMLLYTTTGIIGYADTGKPDLTNYDNVLAWPADGTLIDGQLNPALKGMVVTQSDSHSIVPVDGSLSYIPVNDSFLVPTTLGQRNTIPTIVNEEVTNTQVEDLTLFLSANITFGTYDGPDGWKGAGLHVRGSQANQLRARILKDMGGGNAVLFIEHVNAGNSETVAMLPLALTANENDSMLIEVLSEPESISVWINDVLIADTLSVAKLTPTVGLYYCHNNAQFTNFKVIILDELYEKPALNLINWPAEGTEIIGQLNPGSLAKVVTVGDQTTIRHIDGSGQYVGIDDSFLIPTIFDGRETVELSENGVKVEKAVEDITFTMKSTLTFGNYVGDDGWKGAGLHVRGSLGSHLRVRILRNMGSGFATLYIQGVGYGDYDQMYPLDITAEPGQVYEIEVLSEPEAISVWINGQLIVDQKAVPKLAPTPGVYYCWNDTQITNIAIEADIELYTNTVYQPVKPIGNEDLLQKLTTISQSGKIWSNGSTLTYNEGLITNVGNGFQDTFLLDNPYFVNSEILVKDGNTFTSVLNGLVPMYMRATLSPNEYQDGAVWYGMGLTFKADSTGSISVIFRRTGDVYIVHHRDGEERFISYHKSSAYTSFESGDSLEVELIINQTSVEVYINGMLDIEQDLDVYYDSNGSTVLGETNVASMGNVIGGFFSYVNGQIQIDEVYFTEPVQLKFTTEIPSNNIDLLDEENSISTIGYIWGNSSTITMTDRIVTNTQNNHQDSFFVSNPNLTSKVINKTVDDEKVSVSTGEIPLYIKATLTANEYPDNATWYGLGLTFREGTNSIISVIFRRSGHIYVVNHDNGNERYILYKQATAFSSLNEGESINVEIISTNTTVSIYVNGILEIDQLDLTQYYDSNGENSLGSTNVESMTHTLGAYFAHVNGTIEFNDAYYMEEVEVIVDDDPIIEEPVDEYPDDIDLPDDETPIEPPLTDTNPGSPFLIAGVSLMTVTLGIGIIWFVKKRRGN